VRRKKETGESEDKEEARTRAWAETEIRLALW